MSDGASKTLDSLVTALLEDDDAEGEQLSASEQAQMKAMVQTTSALIAKLHRERTTRRLAGAENARRKAAQAHPARVYRSPLPSKELLLSELRTLMIAGGREAAFHAMKYQDAGPEDLAEMIASVKLLLESKPK
jgi:hypothetical protein